MKRFLIKLFGLKDLEDVIYNAILAQKKEDDKKLDKLLARAEEVAEQRVSLVKQEYDAIIRLKQGEIEAWERKEKSLEDREYKSKMQIKVNHDIAMQIVMKTKEVSNHIIKGVGELEGIFESAEKHNDNIKRVGEKN